MRYQINSRFCALIAGAAGLLMASAAGAEALSALRVVQDKAEVIRLNDAASVVLVANPQIADVVVERNRLLFVLGRRPGETRLYVYGNSGEKLFERDLVVVPSESRAITVTRDTRATTYSCDPRCVALGAGDAPPAVSSSTTTTTAPPAPAR